MSTNPNTPWYELNWYEKKIIPSYKCKINSDSFAPILMSLGGVVYFGLYVNGRFETPGDIDVTEYVTYWAYYPDAPDTNSDPLTIKGE